MKKKKNSKDLSMVGSWLVAIVGHMPWTHGANKQQFIIIIEEIDMLYDML